MSTDIFSNSNDDSPDSDSEIDRDTLTMPGMDIPSEPETAPSADGDTPPASEESESATAPTATPESDAESTESSESIESTESTENTGSSESVAPTPPDSPQPESSPAPSPSEKPIAKPPTAKPAAAPDNNSYRVLARKYRPQSFAELIGQEAMVQTLANAIRRDRLAHAFLMTGVRGVGKTSTARLIARALNCIGSDGKGGPTIDPCGVCEPCRSIAEGSYIDVIEMDAASHTGVDDIRDIIEAVRYTAVAARYKIYIIDEVHMLSKNAFNALLKTLEEPPPHVKFLFATTEVNKIPVTVLSRCQRFDLRRIPPDILYEHFMKIAEKEQVAVDEAAMRLITNAAEGSVRDGLSLLDQAIAHADLDGDQRVEAKQVRRMLGLSDRRAVAQLLAAILEGEAAAAIDLAREQYALGAEPEALVRGLMELVHAVTLTKLARYDDPRRDRETRDYIEKWQGSMSFATLNRLWQLLHKGYEEIRRAAVPFEHLEMVILRIAYAGQLPDPSELARRIEQVETAATASATVPTETPAPASTAPTSPPAPSAPTSAPVSNDNNSPTALADELAAPAPPPESEVADNVRSFTSRTSTNSTSESNAPAPSPALDTPSDIDVTWLCTQLEKVNAHRLAVLVHDHLRVVELAMGRLSFLAAAPFDKTTIAEIRQSLEQATAQTWDLQIADSQASATLSLREQAEITKQAAHEALLTQPLVKAALVAFPQAQMLSDSPSTTANQAA